MYHIDEVSGAPGQLLVIDFISVHSFNWVQLMLLYTATSAGHHVQAEMYNWVTTSWVLFDSADPRHGGQGDMSFFVPENRDYIGTGLDLGKVRVRINHPSSGNTSHDSDIDVCALYKARI